jgi:hypothetical protein
MKIRLCRLKWGGQHRAINYCWIWYAVPPRIKKYC